MLNTLKKLPECFFFLGGGGGPPRVSNQLILRRFDYAKTFFGSPSAFHQVYTLPGKHLVFFLNIEGVNYKILHFTGFLRNTTPWNYIKH